MCSSRRLIERYVLAGILPYLCLAWLILTAVLLAQQLGKFAGALGGAGAPPRIMLEVLAGVIPNISVFTLPMAMLIGTAAAFGRMGSDSEITAMRAAGVGTWRIVSPVLSLGLLLSALTLFNGFEIAPGAARAMRQALLRTTLLKLESPVQPRSFNTQMPGKVIYVRDGDEKRGQWGRVFIYWLETGGELRLVTARAGRIDHTGEQSELVLSDAVVTTLPPTPSAGQDLGAAQVVTESSAQLRVRLNTGRSSVLRQLRERPEDLDESDWATLRERGRRPDAEGRAALSALHKRAALCTTPLAFALLGVGLGLRARRGGRGLAVLLSLLSMLLFYFVFLGGDYLSRIGAVAPALGAWLATILAFSGGCVLLGLAGRSLPGGWGAISRLKRREATRTIEARRGLRKMLFSGLLDRNIFLSLALNFSLTLLLLLGVFLIFTLFELLRFLAVTGVGARTVARYLWYLVPLAGLSVAPICVLVATLITYSLLARRSETVAWWACGQSLYRMALPGAAFALLICWGYWVVQEQILPHANRQQDALRLQIRGGPVRAVTSAGLQWLAASDRSIYAYQPGSKSGELLSPMAFLFEEGGVHLRSVITGAKGGVEAPGLRVERAAVLELPASGGRKFYPAAALKIEEDVTAEMFKPQLMPPSALNTNQLSEYIKLLRMRGSSPSDLATYSVTHRRRLADPLAPLVMAILSIPLATMFGRRSAVLSLFTAVVLGVTFWGGVSLFQQLGFYGLIPPTLAAFALPLLFATIGTYIFSRAGT